MVSIPVHSASLDCVSTTAVLSGGFSHFRCSTTSQTTPRSNQHLQSLCLQLRNFECTNSCKIQLSAVLLNKNQCESCGFKSSCLFVMLQLSSKCQWSLCFPSNNAHAISIKRIICVCCNVCSLTVLLPAGRGCPWACWYRTCQTAAGRTVCGWGDWGPRWSCLTSSCTAGCIGPPWMPAFSWWCAQQFSLSCLP